VIEKKKKIDSHSIVFEYFFSYFGLIGFPKFQRSSLFSLCVTTATVKQKSFYFLAGLMIRVHISNREIV